MIITLELLPHQNGNAENGTSSGNGKSGFSFGRILNLNKCQFYSSDSFWGLNQCHYTHKQKLSSRSAESRTDIFFQSITHVVTKIITP